MIKKDEVFKIGIFNKPHGVKGEISFTFTDDIFDRVECEYLVCLLDGIFVPFFIEEYRFRSDTTALVKLEGVDTSEKARMFTNVEVYFPKKYVAGDDIRLKWTIIKDKATSVPGDTHWSSTVPYSVSTDSHKSGRVTRKVYIPYAQRPEPYDASHNPLNYRILRYADVLLMYAEVENVLKDDGQARWALNKVRERVDLDPVESSGTELRDAIRQERRLELALENQRLFDIRRWKNDSGKSVMSDIMGPNGSFVIYNTKESTDTYELGNQKESSSKGRNFKEERDLVYPIPTTEISQSNGSIVQNPGYN